MCVYSFYYFLVFFYLFDSTTFPSTDSYQSPVLSLYVPIYYMSKPFHARLVVVQRNYIIHAHHIHMPTILSISRIISYIIYFRQ